MRKLRPPALSRATNPSGRAAGQTSYLSLSHRTSEDTAPEGPTAGKLPGKARVSPLPHTAVRAPVSLLHTGDDQGCLPHHTACSSLGGSEDLRVLGRETINIQKGTLHMGIEGPKPKRKGSPQPQGSFNEKNSSQVTRRRRGQSQGREGM